jgi:cobalt-precorrin-5B (C1)-methyltransferase
VKKVLRHGYTTGACSAASAKGAAMMLRDQKLYDSVSIILPTGQDVLFNLHGQTYSTNAAACFVVKDAGDDPDVTHGAEIHATVTRDRDPLSVVSGITITGGTGIGRVTKPGLAVAPGEYAINPVPRRMITEAVSEVFDNNDQQALTTDAINITISIPDGEIRAAKTLNARLGIMGGLSILGTTGVVRPVSAKAWTDTIDAALDVARACHCRTAVFSTGRTSEMAAQHLDDESSGRDKLPEEAYIMMGDHIAHALKSALTRGFDRPVIACQFAKLVKIACGYENTHAAASDMDLKLLQQWCREAGLPNVITELIATANTAREVAVASNFDRELLRITAEKACLAAGKHAPGIAPVFLVADYSNRIIFSSSDHSLMPLQHPANG